MVTSIVTGGAGFIGSHLVEALIARGRKVTVIDDLSNGRSENLESVKGKIDLMINDISNPSSFMKLDPMRVDEIYHLACYPRQISFGDPIRDCQVNLMGAIRCLEFARHGKAKMLFTSNTGIVSKPDRLPVVEDAPPNPLTPYDAHKLSAEYMLKLYNKYYHMRTVVVRFASIYGPRQQINEALGWRPVIPEFITKVLRGEAPTIDGDGKQTRDLLYVGDAVAGVIQAMECERETANNGGMFILGTNKETSVNEMYEGVAALLNSKIKAKHGPPKAEDIMRMRYDSCKAEHTFGWSPKVRFATGLEETIRWHQRNAA